jgi:hypothetical protein
MKMGKLSTEKVMRRSEEVGSEFLDDFYINNSYKHRFKCAECGGEFYRAFKDVINSNKPKNKCLKCSPKNERLPEDKYNSYIESFKSNNKIEVLSPYIEYKNNTTKLKCKCLICNEVFYKNLNNMKSGQMHGCLFISEGERIVLTYFENHGIMYKYQVTLPNNLISDFEVITEDGLIHLEIDGDQHFEISNRYCNSFEELIKRQEYDNLKDKYYSNNGYINLHIRYQSNGKKNDDIFKILNEIKNNKYGKVRLKEGNLNFDVIDLATRNQASKRILCYNLNGEFIKEYNSILEASRKLNINRSTISDCIEGKYGRAKQYIFASYQEDYPLKIEKYVKADCKQVICYNLDGTFNNIFDSINDASRELDISAKLISACVNGKLNKSDTYIIKEYNNMTPLSILPYTENKISIDVFKNDKYFKSYDSINKAYKELGISRKRIAKSLKGNIEIDGYKFLLKL